MSSKLPEEKNIRFLFNNAAENATLTCNTVYGELPESNLLISGKYKVMRTTGTGMVLDVVWEEDQIVNVAAFSHHNLTDDAIVNFYLYDEQGGTLLVSKSFTYVSHTMSWVLPVNNPYIGKYLKITVQDDDNPDGFIEIGRFGAGQAFVPKYNIKVGCTLEYEQTPDKQERTKAGTHVVFPGFTYRVIKFALDFIDMEERNYLDGILRTMPRNLTFFTTVYPNWDNDMSRSYEGFFHLKGKRPIQTHTFTDLFSIDWEITDSEVS